MSDLMSRVNQGIAMRQQQNAPATPEGAPQGDPTVPGDAELSQSMGSPYSVTNKLEQQLSVAERLQQVGVEFEQLPEVQEDPSLMDRWRQTTDFHAASIADSVSALAGKDQRAQELIEGRALTGMEEIQAAPTAGQFAFQLTGDVAGTVFDWGADAVIEAGTEGFQLLPQSSQEFTKEQLGELVNSKVGQLGFKALKGGAESWAAFERQYPQQAKTLAKGFNLFGMGAARKVGRHVLTELQPLRVTQVGQRNVIKAPKGRDKDVYNLIEPEQTKAQRLQQIQEGQVTEPTGLSRRQSVTPSEAQWAVVDEVAKTSVKPSKTFVQNTRIIQRKIDDLNDATVRLTGRVKGGISGDVLSADLMNKVNVLRNQLPAIFGETGTKGVKTVDDLSAQLTRILNKHGDGAGGGTFSDLLAARKEFDNFVLEKMQAGTFGSGRRASVATEFHRAARDLLNGYVKDNVPGTEALLNRQHLLFQGLDGVAPKAAAEAATALGRIVQGIRVHLPSTPLSLALTAASPFTWVAGAGALAISPAVFAYKVGVKPLAYSGPVRRAKGAIDYSMRDVITESKKVLGMIKDPELRRAYAMDVKVLTTLAHVPTDSSEKADE